MNHTTRLVININDIRILIGTSDRTARRLMDEMKKHYGKKRGQFITVTEFCKFTGLDRSDVEAYLR